MVPNGPDLSELLTPEEVAETLRISVRTVRRMAASGLLERVRIGHRTTRYRATEVAALIDRLAASGDGVTEGDRIATALAAALGET
jgi:excisionase family DNA binding protein